MHTSVEPERRLKLEDLGTEYLVRGTTEEERYGLSSFTDGDLPKGPRNTWAYRDPFLSVEEGIVTFKVLEISSNNHIIIIHQPK